MLTEWCNLTEVFNDVHSMDTAGLKGCLAHLKLLDLIEGVAKHGFGHNAYQMHTVENVVKVVQDCWQLRPEGLRPTNQYQEGVEGEYNS